MQNVQSEPRLYSSTDKVKICFLAFLAVVFLMQLVSSLSWRLGVDTSFMHYVAYLINEHGFAPYRDIFEVNMPGSYLFHMAIGKLFGYSDFAFRIVDVTWILTTLTVTWFLMKPAGRMTATASCLLFGNIYLAQGIQMSLQRDIIAILPVATALLIGTRGTPWRSIKLTYWLVGVLFACAVLIKPHMVMGFPVIVAYNAMYGREASTSTQAFIKNCLINACVALLGFFLTLVGPFLWVWHIGALQSFGDIFSSFTPLYAQLSHNLELMEAFPRFKYAVKLYLNFSDFRILFLGALLGVLYVWTAKGAPRVKRLANILFLFTIIYSLYVAIGGKFWRYHWMPCIYFASLCTALTLSSFTNGYPTRHFSTKHFISLFSFVLAVILTVQPLQIARHHAFSKDPFLVPTWSSSLLPRADEITMYLTEHLSPADTVQALDWGGGALYAMLRSQAVTATPYITDFQFYHHVSTPYIQQLRADFMNQMNENKPTFILDVHARVSIKGIDTSDEFPELETFIQENYRKDYEGNGFDVFRKLNGV